MDRVKPWLRGIYGKMQRLLVGTYREPQTWTGYGTYTFRWQTKSPTCPANIGKDSCIVYTSLPLSANTYWIMHALYFALINLNLNFQFCDKARPDLLTNLLGSIFILRCQKRQLAAITLLPWLLEFILKSEGTVCTNSIKIEKLYQHLAINVLSNLPFLY